MIVKVHLTALGHCGEYREVEVPESEVLDARTNLNEALATEFILERTFYWGLNDHQEQGKPSVSMGDVAELDGRYWLCLSIGWKELTTNEWLNYLGSSLKERLEFAMNPSFV